MRYGCLNEVAAASLYVVSTFALLTLMAHSFFFVAFLHFDMTGLAFC